MLQCGSKLTKTFPFRIFGGIFRVRTFFAYLICDNFTLSGLLTPLCLPPPLPISSSLSWWQQARLCSVIKTSCWSRLDILITSSTITLTSTEGSQMNQDWEGRYRVPPAPTTHRITLYNYSHFSRLEVASI